MAIIPTYKSEALIISKSSSRAEQFQLFLTNTQTQLIKSEQIIATIKEQRLLSGSAERRPATTTMAGWMVNLWVANPELIKVKLCQALLSVF